MVTDPKSIQSPQRISDCFPNLGVFVTDSSIGLKPTQEIVRVYSFEKLNQSGFKNFIDIKASILLLCRIDSRNPLLQTFLPNFRVTFCVKQTECFRLLEVIMQPIFV